MAEPMQCMTAAELRDEGYLAEVNRRFFHPLGLAMYVNVETNEFGILDNRADPEGWYMGDVDDDLKAKAANVRRIEAERAPARVAALGYVIQPIDDSHATALRSSDEPMHNIDSPCWCGHG